MLRHYIETQGSPPQAPPSNNINFYIIYSPYKPLHVTLSRFYLIVSDSNYEILVCFEQTFVQMLTISMVSGEWRAIEYQVNKGCRSYLDL